MFRDDLFRSKQGALNKSNTQLAADAKTSRPLIIKIRKGEVDTIKIGTLKKVANELGLSLRDLFDEQSQIA